MAEHAAPGRYYHLVPVETLEQIEWRRGVLKLGYESQSASKDLWRACSRDILFWLNTFGYTYDPRKVTTNEHPIQIFNTYHCQDLALLDMQAAVADGHDLVIRKSRDMGATWLCLACFEWFWQFREYHSFMVASRNADLVDKSQDPDSLFWKLDFLIDHQPSWMYASGERRKFNLLNLRTHSTIDGAATTGDLGRGGRRTGIMVDEHAAYEIGAGYQANSSSQHNTACRLFNSTPKGPGRCFDDLCNKGDIKQLTLHWSEHPEKRVGLYTSVEGRFIARDPGYVYPHDFHPILDGKLRSPWYDLECQRANHPQEIAQELDIDSSNAEFRFFEAALFKDLKGRGEVQAPWAIGELDYDAQSIDPAEFHVGAKGRWSLWFHLGTNGKPPRHEDFVIGVDVAEGTGASNSVIEVWHKRTGEQTAEFVDPYAGPDELANMAVAAARWFNGAKIKWEANGPGRSFGKRVIALHYRHIYYREREDLVLKKTTDIPGWWATKDNKRNLLFEFRKGIKNEVCVPRSVELLRDAEGYVHANGKIEHVKARNTQDPTGAGESHGDRALAGALAFSQCAAEVSDVAEPSPRMAPEGSFGHRRKLWEDSRRTASAVEW